jgi:hypothetical protein
MALSRTPYTPFSLFDTQPSVTTGDYTFPNGELVAVVVHVQNNGGVEDPAALISIANSGADLGWTKRVAADGGSSFDYNTAVVIFTTVGDGSVRTLTISKTGANGICWYVAPYSWTGYNTSSPFGGKLQLASPVSDGAWNPTLDATPATDSDVLGAISGAANSGSINVDVGSGCTELYDAPFVDFCSAQAQVRTGSASTTFPWADIANGGGGYYHNPAGVALEIKAASTGGIVNTVTAEDVTTVVDAFISLILRLRGATETTIISEGGLTANTLHNLLSSDPSDVIDSFLRRVLSNRMQEDSTITVDSFLSSLIGSAVNAVTASDVLIVADGFITILRRMRDAAETTIISEGGLDINTLYNLFVDESLEIADSFIRRMLLTSRQGDSTVFTDDFLSSVSGGGVISSIASDAIQVTWQALLSAYRERLGSESTATVDSALSISLFSLMTSSLISTIDQSVAQLKILMVAADTLQIIDEVASVLTRFTGVDGSKIRVSVDQPTIQLGGYST